MNKSNKESLNNIQLRIPVKLGYPVLTEALKAKMLGEHIKKEDEDGEDSNYAKILDIGVSGSELEAYDLAVRVKFKTLTTFFHGKIGEVIVHATLKLDREKQQVYVSDFKLLGGIKNKLVNGILHTLINSWMYKKMKEKLSFNFRPVIEEQLIDLNKKLIGSMEVKEGVTVSGYLDNFAIEEIVPVDKELIVSVSINGMAYLNLTKIDTE